ncbi:MAG TPA: LuxR C-terminal-related transcriptional regulator, partial [Ilumatobacteraceae bacterium]|nr:LuxR C-terminal-related transcriptional regulator [Ilumatobacteraceae bacterium]
ELGDRTGLELFACVGRQQLWWCYRELGDRRQMERWFDEAAERVRGPDLEQLSQTATVAVMDGNLVAADRLADIVDAVAAPTDLAQAYTGLLRRAISDCRGRLPPSAALEREAASGAAWSDVAEAMLTRASARTGNLPRAKELLDKAGRRDFSTPYTAWGWAVAISCWAEAAGIAEHTPAAKELSRLLDPIAGRLVDGGTYVWDTVDRVRALLLLSLGDFHRAADIAQCAVAASRRRRTPIFLGRELIVWAAARRRSGIDTSEVAAAVKEAQSIARRTGARVIIEDAKLLLTAPLDEGRSYDQFGLTPREREVVDHVAAGATNAQIAADLAISRATVRKHLEHAYEKLQVSTRTAAAARATDRHTFHAHEPP